LVDLQRLQQLFTINSVTRSLVQMLSGQLQVATHQLQQVYLMHLVLQHAQLLTHQLQQQLLQTL